MHEPILGKKLKYLVHELFHILMEVRFSRIFF